MRRRILAGAIPWWVEQHPRKAYIVAANLATPDWVDRRELTLLHRVAKRLTLLTGTEYVLDHVVPLSHPDVCGLTVPWNLQIVTRAQNAAKSNKWSPNQLEFEFMSNKGVGVFLIAAACVAAFAWGLEAESAEPERIEDIIAAKPTAVPALTVERVGDEVKAVKVHGADGRVVAILLPDGGVEVVEGKPEDAARAFWVALSGYVKHCSKL